MNLCELRDYISSLTGHVTFAYNGRSCGIDPLALHCFDLWYGEDAIKLNSVEEVFTVKIFGNKSLEEIWDDVANDAEF